MIRTLTADDFESLYAAFLAAFSDYVVPLAMTREQLAERNTRRGYVPELSAGAFDGEAMVAFTLNCVDGDRGYDTGTGVIPTHRRTGLGRQVMEKSIELLRERCREYVLEVVDGNTKAFELYRSLGFEVSRGLQCWAYEFDGEGRSFDGFAAQDDTSFDGFAAQDDRSFDGFAAQDDKSFDGFAAQDDTWCDFEPSWQNSTASVARAKAEHVTIGDERGYAIVFPESGDLAQLAVRPDARRQGIGTQLLQAAAHVAGKPLRIMNVDERHTGIAAFLERNGARRTVRQFEMIRRLR